VNRAAQLLRQYVAKSAREGEQLRSKAPGRNPGQDEEARVVDDEMESQGALLMGPADEGIAGSDLPCFRTEAEESEHAALSASAFV